MSWLLVAAEELEFSGILKRASRVQPLNVPGVVFAKEVEWTAGRTLLIANGPGPRLAAQAVARKLAVDGIMSVGFCGALDPALSIGDIVVSGEFPGADRKRTDGRLFVQGEVLSVDRVAVTAAEKGELRRTTGASVVEMESAALIGKARDWGVPFCCVKTVSDTARENMPLDFNRYRAADGRFARNRIALAAAARPFTSVPALLRLVKNCRLAAESLGEFLADYKL